MKILVVGRTGQVARALARRDAKIAIVGRPEFDLERPNDFVGILAKHKPDVVINAAAFTSVDRAETDREQAFVINATAAGAMSAASAQIGAAFIHLSTDYVFAGDKDGPYAELDSTGPRSVYGQSKLEGEKLVHAANSQAVTLRTSWVFDAAGANFVRTMLRLARSRDTVNVVADQRGCPTSAGDLAAAILAIASDIAGNGIYHCTNAQPTTWADFAVAIFAESKQRGGPFAEVVRISTAEYPTAAPRPSNSVLSCAKLYSDYGIVLRPWRDALADCMDEIAAGGWSLG